MKNSATFWRSNLEKWRSKCYINCEGEEYGLSTGFYHFSRWTTRLISLMPLLRFLTTGCRFSTLPWQMTLPTSKLTQRAACRRLTCLSMRLPRNLSPRARKNSYAVCSHSNLHDTAVTISLLQD